MSKFQDRLKEEKAKQETFGKLGLNSVDQGTVNNGIHQGIDFVSRLILDYYDKANVEVLNKSQMECLLNHYKEVANKNFTIGVKKEQYN